MLWLDDLIEWFEYMISLNDLIECSSRWFDAMIWLNDSDWIIWREDSMRDLDYMIWENDLIAVQKQFTKNYAYNSKWCATIQKPCILQLRVASDAKTIKKPMHTAAHGAKQSKTMHIAVKCSKRCKDDWKPMHIAAHGAKQAKKPCI